MTATLLSSGKFVIENVPDLRDVKTMLRLLKIIGVDVTFSKNKLNIETSNCNTFEAPYDLVRTMRASIYVLGPLVGRYGYAKVSLPGGCAWGPRPVNLHLEGLKKLGADITLEQGYVIAKAKKLEGALIEFDGAVIPMFHSKQAEFANVFRCLAEAIYACGYKTGQRDSQMPKFVVAGMEEEGEVGGNVERSGDR